MASAVVLFVSFYVLFVTLESLTFVLYSAIYFLKSLAKVFSLPQHIF